MILQPETDLQSTNGGVLQRSAFAASHKLVDNIGGFKYVGTAKPFSESSPNSPPGTQLCPSQTAVGIVQTADMF
jgi:hypothetical protein